MRAFLEALFESVGMHLAFALQCIVYSTNYFRNDIGEFLAYWSNVSDVRCECRARSSWYAFRDSCADQRRDTAA